jgi:hypothetical protein
LNGSHHAVLDFIAKDACKAYQIDDGVFIASKAGVYVHILTGAHD